jgi:hypothetical protein
VRRLLPARRAPNEPPRWWTVRRAQNLKPATYRCPFCHELLPARDEWLQTQPGRKGLLPRLFRPDRGE